MLSVVYRQSVGTQESIIPFASQKYEADVYQGQRNVQNYGPRLICLKKIQMI